MLVPRWFIKSAVDLLIIWLLAGYVLIIVFSIVERTLRKGQSAKTFERGKFDRGSTVLVEAAFASALLLPPILDFLGVGLFSIELIAGLLALLIMVFGIALRLWAARTLGEYYTRTLLATDKQRVVTAGPYTIIRHPGYLGGILTWSGFGVLSSNW